MIKYIYIFNLLLVGPISKPVIDIDMFFEIDAEIFDSKHILHHMSNNLPKEHQDRINTVSTNVKMMELRLRFQQNTCSGLLRVDSEEKLTRENLKLIIETSGNIDVFIADHKFDKHRRIDHGIKS